LHRFFFIIRLLLLEDYRLEFRLLPISIRELELPFILLIDLDIINIVPPIVNFLELLLRFLLSFVLFNFSASSDFQLDYLIVLAYLFCYLTVLGNHLDRLYCTRLIVELLQLFFKILVVFFIKIQLMELCLLELLLNLIV
jgi:hypothetical protein